MHRQLFAGPRPEFCASFTWLDTYGEQTSSLLNSLESKFYRSTVGIFGFLAFESSREALKGRSEDEVLHDDGGRQFLEQASPLTCETNGLATQEAANWY